jgi:hypothetical protein
LNNPLLTKGQTQETAVNAYLFVKAGSADGLVVQASDALSAILGISDAVVNPAAGSPVDVHEIGIAELQLGYAVTRGDFLTSDANGCGIPLSRAGGTPAFYGAQATVSGVSGDIIPVIVCHGEYTNGTTARSVEVTLTSAQILALHGTPISVVPAPAANHANVIKRAIAMFVPGPTTTAYTISNTAKDLALKYTDANGTSLAVFETTGLIDQVVGEVQVAGPELPAITHANLTPLCAAIVANILSGEVTAGDGTVKIHVDYDTIALV